MRAIGLLIALLLGSPLALAQVRSGPAPASESSALALNASRLARGVNFGNMLEAPSEGAWGLTVQESFFDRVKEAGFDHIRLPISWTHHAARTAPYTIEPAFMARIDWCVDQALARGLKIIVNVHHYDELNADPDAERARALSIWDQIATRMKDRPASVYFEVLNEPHGAFNEQPAKWDQFLTQALETIRRTNPARWVLVGPVRWNSIGALEAFAPPADRRLIAAFHFYDPFEFTHQGAEWVSPSPPVGTAWNPDERGIAPPYENWSWLTTISPAPTGLRIEYTAGWAGLQFHRPIATADVRRIEFRADRGMSLRLSAGVDGAMHDATVQVPAGGGVVGLDLPADKRNVQKIIIQNATNSAQPAFTLSDARLITADDRANEPLIATRREQIGLSFDRAVAWAKTKRIPLHMGEFGAYSTADMTSRAAWTRAVREEAEKRGIAWAYWEFAAGFGVYDPTAQTWRAPLRDALVAP